MRPLAAFVLFGAAALSACNMRQDQAGPNSSEAKDINPGKIEPVDETPLSSTPGPLQGDGSGPRNFSNPMPSDR